MTEDAISSRTPRVKWIRDISWDITHQWRKGQASYEILSQSSVSSWEWQQRKTYFCRSHVHNDFTVTAHKSQLQSVVSSAMGR